MKNPIAPFRALGVRSGVCTMWASLALLGCAALAAQIATGSGGAFSTIAVVGLVMAVWTRRAQVVRVFEDHLELRGAPFAPLRLVRFDQILGLERRKKKVQLRYRRGEEDAKVALPMHLLAQEDGEWLVSHLEAKAAG